MLTPVYTNWLTKTRECGFTNEQACGLAMLHAWTLTQRKSADEVPDAKSYWVFVEQDDFDQINAFTIEDFARFVPEFKFAGELLRVQLPADRVDSDGKPAHLLDLEWEASTVTGSDIDDVLLLRHRFDVLWCQRVGESLREEIRTPRHAYAFANTVTHGFLKFDPEGFTRILDKILGKKSPLAYMFSSGNFMHELNGLDGYEPFQIALLGFTSGLDPKLGELVWNLQRVLYYKQPGGVPINLDKQYLPTPLFLAFAEPVLTNFLHVNRSSYLNSTRLIGSEYVLAKSGEQHATFQLHELMDKRYGFLPSLDSDTHQLNLLTNVAAFYTLCCIRIRNLTNRINDLPSLRMVDDVGLLWTRDIEEAQPLRDEAIQCFDIMLSWRLGATWGLFLETESGFVQRVYVGDSSEHADVEKLFTTICTAYRPVRCVVAFMTNGRVVKGEDGETSPDVCFLYFEGGEEVSIDIFRSGFDLERGQFLGKFLGRVSDAQMTQGAFPAVQSALNAPHDDAIAAMARVELAEMFPPAEEWEFERSNVAVQQMSHNK